MGGGITGSKGNPESNEVLSARSQDLYNISRPLVAQAAGQVGDILSTGGTNAMIPNIQRMVEGSMAATSQAKQRTSEDLTRQGFTGTDYNTILANMTQQGAFQASQIPGNFYNDILSTFYKSLTGTPQLAMQGFSGAAGNETAINVENTRAAGEMIKQIIQSTGQVGAAAAMACWIARRLYGLDSPDFYFARWYILSLWRGPHASCIRWLYRRYGQRVSTSPILCWLLKPLFDLAVRRGRRALYAGKEFTRG